MVCWSPHSVHTPVWYLVLHDIPCINCGVMVKVCTTAGHTCYCTAVRCSSLLFDRLCGTEIWTALGYVNGAGSVCELWPVARNSPLPTKYLEKEGKERDYWSELKKNKVCGKLFEDVVKGSEGKDSEVQHREGVKGGCNGKGIYEW